MPYFAFDGRFKAYVCADTEEEAKEQLLYSYGHCNVDFEITDYEEL